MKTKRFSSLLAGISLAAVLILSCSALKDIGDNGLLGSSNLLQNGKLGLMAGTTEVPDGSVDVIESVEINGTALSGGSTSITITAKEALDTLYLQIEGDPAVYVWAVEPDKDLISSPGDQFYVYQISLLFSQELGEDEDGQELPARTLTISGKTAAGEVVEKVEEEMEVKQVGSGALQISLSWDVDADLDLNVFTPSGKRLYWNTPNKIIPATDTTGKGELDVDSNGDRRLQGADTLCVIDGIRSENIFFDAPLENGEYKVVVNLSHKCGTEQGARYNVTANLGHFIQFSNNQSGKFDDDAPRNMAPINVNTIGSASTKVIGTIRVQNGQVVN